MTSHLLLPQQSLLSARLRVETEAGCQAETDGLGLEGWRSQALPHSGQADQELLQQPEVFDAGGRNCEGREENVS